MVIMLLPRMTCGRDRAGKGQCYAQSGRGVIWHAQAYARVSLGKVLSLAGRAGQS